jgi:hypothetical protein
MLHLVVGATALAALAAPAAAVQVDPSGAAAPTSDTVFTASDFTGTGVSGEFELLKDGVVSASVSATGGAASISLFEITDMGGGSEATADFNFDPTTNLAFAGIEGVSLGAGTYELVVAGDFTNAAISGEVSAVPIPGAAVLLGTAVVGLGAMRARRRSAS